MNGTECTDSTAKILIKHGSESNTGENLPGFVWSVVRVTEVLKSSQGTLFTDPEGIAKPRSRIMQNYWWPSMDRHFQEFLEACGKCQKTRKDGHPKPDFFTPLPIGTEPNKRIHADLFGALVTSGNNKKYVLFMTGAFTNILN